MSHADVTGDHHAFFYADGLAVIPMTLIKKDTTLSPFVSSGIVEFSGAMVLAVGDQATPVARISHAEWIPAACKEVQKSGTWWATNSSSFDVRRVTKLGEKIISFSPFGFKVNDSARNFSTTYSKSFQAEDEECSALTVTPFRI